MNKRLVVISGPSGVGKGMIIDWQLKSFFPEFYNKNDRYRKDIRDLCIVPVYKTKTEGGGKAGESKYGKSDSKNIHSFYCRRVEQEINLDELDESVEKHNATLIEVYYKAFDFLKERYESSGDFASTFVSPLDAEEIRELTEQGKRLEDYLPNLMLDSLVKRAERDGKAFTQTLIKELEQRAEDSVNELRFAHNYKQVISNHCYEYDSRWKFPMLIGEPRKIVSSLKDIINRGYSDYASSGKDFSFI